ncbi:flagellar biosynthesis protein FlgB [Cypionkella aquatica]|uniref:Flagellar biosynthesis protein FlgB n=1 Tax=Cypionkella aquatica TaxID=1756042 RepID=A0AA37TNR0_9RHOB|nr:FlgB family protein [Cypionkella aquatica]GLS85184.1 flagellar biosynthesis protein FlgB [Cypionkella aquatica]
MFEKLQLTNMANAMAERAGARMGVVAQNIANADTPGYKTMDTPSFADTYQDGGTPMRMTRPEHMMGQDQTSASILRGAKGSGAPNGNTVSLEQEMVKTVTIRQDHDMALAIYRNTSEIIRASLGRAR